MTHCQSPAPGSPSSGVHVVVCLVVVPTLALLEISLATEWSLAFDLLLFPLCPYLPEIPTEAPANPALASAVTEAFQPLSSDLFNYSALFCAVWELSELVMPTE